MTIGYDREWRMRSRTDGDSHALQPGGFPAGVKILPVNQGPEKIALRLNMIDLIPDGLPTAV